MPARLIQRQRDDLAQAALRRVGAVVGAQRSVQSAPAARSALDDDHAATGRCRRLDAHVHALARQAVGKLQPLLEPAQLERRTERLGEDRTPARRHVSNDAQRVDDPGVQAHVQHATGQVLRVEADATGGVAALEQPGIEHALDRAQSCGADALPAHRVELALQPRQRCGVRADELDAGNRKTRRVGRQLFQLGQRGGRLRGGSAGGCAARSQAPEQRGSAWKGGTHGRDVRQTFLCFILLPEAALSGSAAGGQPFPE